MSELKLLLTFVLLLTLAAVVPLGRAQETRKPEAKPKYTRQSGDSLQQSRDGGCAGQRRPVVRDGQGR